MKRKKKLKRKLYEYEVGLWVPQVWVMQVTARNCREAKRLARTGKAIQLCSVRGRGYVKRGEEVSA